MGRLLQNDSAVAQDGGRWPKGTTAFKAERIRETIGEREIGRKANRFELRLYLAGHEEKQVIAGSKSLNGLQIVKCRELFVNNQFASCDIQHMEVAGGLEDCNSVGLHDEG